MYCIFQVSYGRIKQRMVIAVNPRQHSHGGARPGAGRPKKKARDLQKTHSIRATDKDWQEIQRAARIIKSCTSEDKHPHVFLLRADEAQKINKFLIEGFIENSQVARWGPTEPPPPPQPVQKRDIIQVTKPKDLTEEEAVSKFLEYYRLNKIDCMNMIENRLERERRLMEIRKQKARDKAAMDRIEDNVQDAIDNIDDINARIEKMLRFPGMR